jgi:hypothetical protein
VGYREMIKKVFISKKKNNNTFPQEIVVVLLLRQLDKPVFLEARKNLVIL